jgi:hypothetical protein
MSLRRALDLLLAGAAWGLVALLLGGRAFRGAIWTGALFSPLIGLLVGGLLQPLFERRNGPVRWLIALIALYLGAALFGLALSIERWSTTGETIMGIWWGITLTGFLVILWPLAYFTQWMLEQREQG